MRAQRLGWAGLQVTALGVTLVVDLVEAAEPLRSVLPKGSIRPASGPVDVALVSHLHSDHADPAAIEGVLGQDGVVLRPEPCDSPWTVQAELGFKARRMSVHVVTEWQEWIVGPVRLTAVPAVDGLGDPQVNWVIEAGDKRIFHGGDTMFHGRWWQIADRLGPFDIAFLPINGAAVDFPHLQPPSPLPAVLTPDQAAVAARILGARQVVPIHYGVEGQAAYVEVDDPVEAFRQAAKERGVEAVILDPGSAIDVGR